MEALLDWMAANPQVWAWFTTAVRFLFPVLALLILIRTIRSLLTVPCLPEVWAYLTLPNGAQEPLTHWENILGRGGNSDVILNYPVVSRQHAALIRQADDTWTAYDLGSKGGVTVNGRPVEGSAPVQYGDVVGIGGVETGGPGGPCPPGWGWCSSPCSRPSPHSSSPSARGRTPR